MSIDPNQPQQPQPHQPQPPVKPADNENTMAMLSHLLGVLTGFIGPLVIFLIKKDERGFAGSEAKEALNWQLTVLIGILVSIPLMFIFIGIFTWAAIVICNIIFCIMGCISANKGIPYRYPFAIRMIS